MLSFRGRWLLRCVFTGCFFTVHRPTGRSDFGVHSLREALLSVGAGLIWVRWPLPKVSLSVDVKHHRAGLPGACPLWWCGSSPSPDGMLCLCAFMIGCAGGGKQASLPSSTQAIKNSFHFYLWVGLSAQQTTNRRKAYSEKANIDFCLPSRDSNSSLSLKQLEGRLGWRQYGRFWFLMMPLFIHLHGGECTAGQHANKMFLS